jgi:two-component system, LytTR family, sensor kinase
MKDKWIKYHILFFAITWIYKYVFNFYLAIPDNELLSHSLFFLVDNAILVGYFYCFMFLSKFFLRRMVYFIPFQLIFMVVGCFILALFPYSFYLYEGAAYSFSYIYFMKMFEVAYITFGSLGFLFLKKWDESTNLKVQLIEALSHAELTFLRSQMSPHFLLNTLNSIYSLALNKSPEIYPAIAELKNIYSDIQRNQGKVSLKDEVAYLDSFIKIQRRRFGEGVELKVLFKVDRDYQIEPLLLSSFVENAFKHGVSMKERSYINISLFVTNGMLAYEVTNTDHSSKFKDSTSGIGIPNLFRRLELLYPGRFALRHSLKGNIYNSILIITQL